jgi:hypothetical protein
VLIKSCQQTPVGLHQGQQRLCVRNRMRELRTYGSVGGGRMGNHRLYPAADGEQAPLVPRSTCSPPLRPGVAMTSNVKGWEQLFLGLHAVFSPSHMRRGGASKRRRLILLLSVGWVPPSLHPSGACLNRGTSVPVGPLNAAEGDTKPGLRLFSCTWAYLLTVLRRGRGLESGRWNVFLGNKPLL